MPHPNKDENELGALWSRENERGEFLTGTIKINGEELNVVCFKVKSDNPRAPKWRVLKAKPREQEAF